MKIKLIDRLDSLIRKSNFPILMLLVVFVVMCFIYLFQLDNFNRQVVNVIQFFIFDKSRESLAKAGTYGDFIGGILGTLIGIIGAIYVYKTFKSQQEIFRKGRFENRFFEMIKLHNEYVRDLNIEGYEALKQLHQIGHFNLALNIKHNNEGADIIKKETKGKKIFVTTFYEFVSCYEICKAALNFENLINKERYLVKMAYKFLYWGVGINCPDTIDNSVKKDKEYIKLALKLLKEAKNNHYTSGGTKNLFKIPNSNIEVKIHVKYKPFSGHSSRLGQYYRQLFEIVKYVIQNENILFDYSESRRYLKLLRAQLSDHEQLMLYYNYLSGYGKDWENSREPLNKNNLFSRYRMIHNIPIKSAKIGIDILEEFKPAIELIREQGIKEGEYYEMFEQLEG